MVARASDNGAFVRKDMCIQTAAAARRRGDDRRGGAGRRPRPGEGYIAAVLQCTGNWRVGEAKEKEKGKKKKERLGNKYSRWCIGVDWIGPTRQVRWTAGVQASSPMRRRHLG